MGDVTCPNCKGKVHMYKKYVVTESSMDMVKL